MDKQTPPALLILVHGLPATGKTTLARRLATACMPRRIFLVYSLADSGEHAK